MFMQRLIKSVVIFKVPAAVAVQLRLFQLISAVGAAALMVALGQSTVKSVPVTTAVHSSSANFTVDLAGVPDTRPGTWGTQGQATWSIVFKPPTGKRTHILHVDGDFLVWPPKPIVPGSSAGVLLALSSTAPGGSIYGTLMADNTFLYLQIATMGQPTRAAYDRDVTAGGLLMPDNILVVKVAVWLNTTGTAIHIEPTFVLRYQFE